MFGASAGHWTLKVGGTDKAAASPDSRARKWAARDVPAVGHLQEGQSHSAIRAITSLGPNVTSSSQPNFPAAACLSRTLRICSRSSVAIFGEYILKRTGGRIESLAGSYEENYLALRPCDGPLTRAFAAATCRAGAHGRFHRREETRQVRRTGGCPAASSPWRG